MTQHRNKVPFFAVCRHRIGIDGLGVTTLVTCMGCTLHCKYCPNKICHTPVSNAEGTSTADYVMLLSPKELYDKVHIDNLYFRATDGGVCFGGGEQAIYSHFIEEFRLLCGDKWKLTIETSLNCASEHIRRLSSVIDYWIIDIKDMNPVIYRNYTGCDQDALMRNLKYISAINTEENITIRVPHIGGFNTDNDIKRSIIQLNELGFHNIEELVYVQ